MLLWASGKFTFERESPTLDRLRPPCLISSVFNHMSRDRPPARPPAVASYVLACARSQGRPSVNVTLTLSCCGMPCGKFKKNIKDGGGMEPQTPLSPSLGWMQMGGRDLRQEGDSRERQRGNDSGTRRRKTSGSASWHFW